MEVLVLVITACILLILGFYEFEKINKQPVLVIITGIFACGSFWHVVKCGFLSYVYNVLFPIAVIVGLAFLNMVLDRAYENRNKEDGQ